MNLPCLFLMIFLPLFHFLNGLYYLIIIGYDEYINDGYIHNKFQYIMIKDNMIFLKDFCKDVI
jgi:hypothetical protein